MPEATPARKPSMPYKPEVAVHQITKSELGLIVGRGKQVDLGGERNTVQDFLKAAFTEAQVESILASLQKGADKVFVLDWKGNKVPRGVKLEEGEVGWTQNGVVTSVTGEMMGTYDRMVEFGGEDRNDQRMIVYIRSPNLQF